MSALGKDVSRYSAATVLAQVVQMVCGLAVLAWIAPAEMGIWLALQAAEAYALWIRLGVVNAMNREYPYLLGRGEGAEALLHVQTTASYMAGCAVLLGLGFAGTALFMRGAGADWQLALVCFGIHSAGGLWRSFVEATFRGGQEFGRLVRLQLSGAVLQILTLPLVWRWGFEGFCLRSVLLATVLTVGWHLARPVKAGFRFDLRVLLKLLREGLPLFASNYLTSVTAQFPRIFLIAAGGTALLGLYAPIAALLAAGVLLPSTLLTFLLPRQNFEFGQGRDVRKLAAQGWRRAGLLCAALFPLGVVGWWGAKIVVEQWMPEYVRAIPALGFAAAMVVLSPLRLVTSLFSTLKAWWPMMTHVLTSLVLTCLLSWLGWKTFPADPLQGVVAGIFAAQLLQTIVTWQCVRWAVSDADALTQPCVSKATPVR